ncbi:cysteine desulfurase [Candidatus Atribacteria bacterium MT.SAG.1]|nr:cysteine desulfurase [Candidatus Atribacteria bacterium MT.SAG.1]
MNFAEIKTDFPILNDIIYMDSASTSLTPEPVLNVVSKYYREYNANVGRGVHRLSQVASQKYKDVHRKIADFIGANEEEVIFTKNTTEAINTVASGLRWKKGDKVVTTLIEHHSNFLPWLRLKSLGVELDIVKPDKNGKFNVSDFKEVIDDKTRLVAVTHVSNVLGTITPIEEISAICEKKNALLLVDGAQSVPHIHVDVRNLGCNFLCFSGHKMLGPTGTGILWMKEDFFGRLEPLNFGGGMIEDVSLNGYELTKGYERFEGGTPNIAGVIGFGRAIDYLKKIGMDKIADHEAKLTERLLEGLLEIRRVEIYGSLNSKERIGLVSFNIKDLNSHDVALMLDEASNIMVRSGHLCCMPLMKYFGLKEGAVRVSLYLYNTEEEVDTFLETVKEIAKC